MRHGWFIALPISGGFLFWPVIALWLLGNQTVYLILLIAVLTLGITTAWMLYRHHYPKPQVTTGPGTATATQRFPGRSGCDPHTEGLHRR